MAEVLPVLLGLFINMDIACVPVCQGQGIPVDDIGHTGGLSAVGLSILHVHVFFLCVHCIGRDIVAKHFKYIVIRKFNIDARIICPRSKNQLFIFCSL